MTDFTPRPQDTNVPVLRRDLIKQLPFPIQSDLLKKFFGVTVNQWFQPRAVDDVSGYIGRRSGLYYKPEKDFYLNEQTKDRKDYQLEPTAVSIDNNNEVNFSLFYQDLVNQLRFQGAITTNHSRLFSQEYYSWGAPINADMFANFSNYYWLVPGPTVNVITAATNAPLDIIGKKSYTTGAPENLKLQSGMKIRLTNDANAEYNNVSFVVEGVGSSIVLIDDTYFEGFGLYDVLPYDTFPYDSDESDLLPQYVTIARESQDINPWSRFNRWFHRDFIKDLDLENFTVFQAKRPIVQFEPNIQLRDFGRWGRKQVDIWIKNETMFDIAGLPAYTVDGIELYDGARVLFTNDPDPAKNNKVYKVFGIDQLSQIGFILETDGINPSGEAVAGENVRINKGDTYRGTELYFNGTSWIIGQNKPNNTQLPLFDLYDGDGVRLDDQGIYPGSNFAGSKIFGFNETIGAELDPFVGLPIKFDNFGNISFNNFLTTDSITYDLNFARENIVGYRYFKKLVGKDPINDYFANDWHKAELESRQYVIDSFIMKSDITAGGNVEFPREFKISIDPDANVADSILNYQVFLNGVILVDGVDYDIIGDILELSLSLELADNDVVDVKSWAFYINNEVQGYFEIPTNLLNNPNNEDIEIRTFNELYGQFISIIENQSGIEGKPFGANNYNSTPRDLSRGDTILQHSAPLLKLMLLTGDKDLDLATALRYSNREYKRFKSKFINKIQKFRTLGYDNTVPLSKWVQDALNEINVGKTSGFAFYMSAMTAGNNYIPSTPASLGVLPTYVPAKFTDTTRSTPTLVLRGHDGSLLDAFGNILDDVILELENQIFNNIDPVYRMENSIREFDLLQVRPGYFRTTEYNRTEWLRITQPGFERWATDEKVDYEENQIYDLGNRFTWNYSKVAGPDGNLLPGNWRGMYEYIFDTDRPHTNPWEMLGFVQKPDWWESEYGPAPYTGGNLVMWLDIESGTIKQGPRAGQYPHLARPGVLNIIPVDYVGNLLDPIAAGIASNIPNDFDVKASWNYGDGGPGEYTWKTSENYSFDTAEALYLAKPAKFVELLWESRYLTRVHGQLVYTDTLKRKSSADFTVHNEILDSGTLVKVLGISQWPSFKLADKGLNIKDTFGDIVRDLNVKLGYKVGGFTKPTTLRLLNDSFGILPQENITVKLYKSASIREPIYSGVIINWDGSQYRVSGYDSLSEQFKIIPGSPTGEKTSIRVDSVTVTRYDSPADQPLIVQYNTGFPNRESVYNFLVGYQRYLETQGWLFEDYDLVTGEPKNFDTAGKVFLQWTQTLLEAGDALILSPLSDEAKITINHGHVEDIQTFVNGVYSVVDKNGYGLSTKSFDVSRLDDKFTVTVDTSEPQGIHGLRLSVVEFEHIVLVDNVTKFNDLVYSPEIGLRQPRFRVFMQKTGQWNGKPEAFGFIIRDDDLLPNFETSVDGFRNYFNFDLVQVPNETINGLAKHLIGYQQREYLSNLLLDERTQFDFYRGVIREKGTIRSITNVLRSDFITQTADFGILEEWAFLLGSYGNNTRKSSIQLQLLQSQFKTNPQLVRFIDTNFDNPEDIIISLTPEDKRWILKRNNNTTIDQFSLRNYKNPYRRDLPNAGYVQKGETTLSVVYENELADLYFNLKNDGKKLSVGDTIWNIILNDGGWDVLRLTDASIISQLSKGTLAGDPATITTYLPHGLQAGDRIYINNSTSSSPDYEGYQVVLNVINATSFQVELPANTNMVFSITTGPQILVLKSSRFAYQPDRNAYTPTAGWLVGDRAWVDNDGSGKWLVSSWNGSSWDIVRQETDKTDIDQVFSTIIYDSVSNQTKIQLNLYDPYKGFIAPIADRELYYKLEFDPAKYTNGDDTVYQIDPDQSWGKEETGRLWWDLRTVRFLDYEQDDLDYKQKTWGQLAPGTVVDIYEWTRSPVLPSSWASYVAGFKASFGGVPSGTAAYGSDTPYVETKEYNPAKGISESVYYFWVKSPNFVPLDVPFRQISAFDVQQAITSPVSQNIPWFAPVAPNAFLVSGVENLIDDSTSILQINFYDKSEESNIHKQWLLARELDSVSPPDQRFWNKMRDSLVGFDDLDNVVPDPNLRSIEKYGNQIRPRQSWFIDRLQARTEFFEKANKLLLENNVVDENPTWDANLRDFDPEPDSSEYDYVVFNRNDRDALVGSILPGDHVLVQSDQLLENRWSLWQYNGGTNWTLLQKQLYRVEDYWFQVDWYASGYDSTVKISQTFTTISARNAGTFAIGEIVKVDNNGTGRWAIYRYDEQNSMPAFIVIAQELGTVEFRDTLGDYDITDSSLDEERSIVTKKLIFALETDLLSVLERNKLFFSMIHYVHKEQQIIDWAFKTSYVYGIGNVDVLEQDYFYVQNQSQNLVNYINEVKPYHVKIRGLIEVKEPPMEIASVHLTEDAGLNVGIRFDRVTGESSIPDGANPKDYDVTKLTAADRVQLLYSPTEGMPEKVLEQLISRIEYGGTILDGKNFYQFGTLLGIGYDNSEYDYFHGYDFDASDLENFYDVYVNGGQQLGGPQTFAAAPTGVSDITIDGNKFIQPHIEEDHPEELIKVRAGDAIVLDVYTTSPGGQVGLGYDMEGYDELPYDFDSTDVIIPFGGSPKTRVKRFRGTVAGNTGPFAIGQLPQNKQALFVYINGTLSAITTDYTVNWSNSTVTLVNPLMATDTLVIISFSAGGSKIKKKKTFKNTSQTSFDLNESFGSDNQVFVAVDGEIATFTTTGTQIDITSPTPSNSTVLIVIFDNSLYSLITTQEEVSSGGSFTFTIDNPAASTIPGYHSTIVYKNGLRLTPPYMKIYTLESTSDFFHIGKNASAVANIRVWRGFQELVSGTDYRSFFVTGFDIANAGTGYNVNDVVNVVGTGSDAAAHVSAVDGLGGITAITLTNPGHSYEGATTATVTSTGTGAVINPQIVTDEIGIMGAVLVGSQLLVMLLEDNDFDITGPDNDQLTIFSTVNGDRIQVTTFSEDVSFGMKTEVFNGNAQTFYGLGDTPFDTNSTLIHVNGVRQVYLKDYTLVENEKAYDDEYLGYGILYDSGKEYGARFKNNAHSSTDKVIITYFTEIPTADPIGFRLYKNIFGNWQYFRISDENSTILTQPLLSSDNVVIVEDASVLATPDVSKNEPGVVFINGERIIYWSVDTTNVGLHELRHCLRGTGGTGINPDLNAGEVVRDGSKDQIIPGGYNFAYTPYGLQQENSTLAKFLLDKPGSYNYP